GGITRTTRRGRVVSARRQTSSDGRVEATRVSAVARDGRGHVDAAGAELPDVVRIEFVEIARGRAQAIDDVAAGPVVVLGEEERGGPADEWRRHAGAAPGGLAPADEGALDLGPGRAQVDVFAVVAERTLAIGGVGRRDADHAAIGRWEFDRLVAIGIAR